MPATYEPISTTILGSATTLVTLSGIPSTYTDLRLVVTGTLASGGAIVVRPNGVTSGSLSSSQYSYTTGSANTSAAAVSQNDWKIGGAQTQSTNASLWGFTLDIFNYTTASAWKVAQSALNSANNTSTMYLINGAHLYRSSTAISSLGVYAAGKNFSIGSTFRLYGILKA